MTEDELKKTKARTKKSFNRIELTVIIPTVTAIIAGLIGFLTSAYVGYLNNQGTLEVERQKEKAAGELEQRKLKTSLILEAVKVGDRQKALDNLTFFIDAGFLDDEGGNIKARLDKNVLPVLPRSAGLGNLDEFIQALGRIFASEGIMHEEKGELDEAFWLYKKALYFLENVSCGHPTATQVRERIEKLPGKPAIEPCVKHPPHIIPAYIDR
jgi:hypothetical protein